MAGRHSQGAALNTFMFNLPTLQSALADTFYAGKLHFSPVTQSTNTDALEAARASAPHGSVFFADEQLAGRGRGAHAWHSAAGQGLYVSVLLRPSIPAVRLPWLALAAGLAAASAIGRTTALTVDIRWPNDLLVGQCKTGGILVEGKTESDEVAFAVVGIGINVHHRAFPTDLSTPATSLDQASGQIVSRQSLLIALLQSLAEEALALESPAGSEAIAQRLQQASSWISGRRVQVHGPQACTGMTAGLDENGFLRVQTEAGLITVQTGGLRAEATEQLQSGPRPSHPEL